MELAIGTVIMTNNNADKYNELFRAAINAAHAYDNTMGTTDESSAAIKFQMALKSLKTFEIRHPEFAD